MCCATCIHTTPVYTRSEEEKRRGARYVIACLCVLRVYVFCVLGVLCSGVWCVWVYVRGCVLLFGFFVYLEEAVLECVGDDGC